MYLVDTNVVSEARRGSRPAVDWLRSVAPEQIYLSVVTLGEIARGIALKERQDPVQAARLQQWLASLAGMHANRILPIPADIALLWGRQAASRPRGDADGLIAATAAHHGLALVTRNAADFVDLPVAVINPWLINP